MDIKTKNLLAIILIIVASALYGCKKEEVPIVTTTSVSNTTATTATTGGNITDEGSSTVITRGVCWSTGTTPTITDNKTSDGAGAGSFSSNLTGLNGATTYYVRAYASNSAGIGYGMALSFTTLGQAPTPTNSATTNISASSATINGSVNANYISTVVTFEYGTTTSYGSTITATQSPLVGSTAAAVSASLTGLTEGTTYHFRIKAVNNLGTSFSPDAVFTTLGQAPIATTQPATDINTSSATLNGSVNANYVSSVVTFEYGTTTSYGSTATATQSPVTGNTTKSVSVQITALSPNSTYHFRIKSVNSIGTIYGTDLTFTTLGQSPTATTQSASSITTSGATLSGIVNANYLSTVITFEYGITVSYDNSVTASQSPITGNSTTLVSADILGLSPNTIYHYRVKAVNVLGTNYGSDMTFTTLGQIPVVTTNDATLVQPFSSNLNGTVNANYLSTTVTFEYGLTTSYGSSTNAAPSPVSGSTITNVSAPITGLQEGTVYHYRIKAVNVLGTSNGSDKTFLTLGLVPTATTQSATDIQLYSSTLNGVINANYLSTSVIFEYGLTTSYGSTVTAAPSPITGSTNTNVSAPIMGLTEGKTYHYRMVATNSLGATNSNDMTFTTLGQVPTAVTTSTTNFTSTSAQINGTINANYLSSIVTFEYGTTTSYGTTVTATQSPVTGNTDTPVSVNITGLTLGTIYHYRVNAVNSLGTTYGNDMTFMYLYYGATYQGGLIFYVDATGQHGLVCASSDQSTSALWGCSGQNISTGFTVGWGVTNTFSIVNECTAAGTGAKICDNLVLNTYSDWFLPSKDEIGLMYTNLKAAGLGSFATVYWSSSAESSTLAWVCSFTGGGLTTAPKVNAYYVRAVRAF